MSLKSWREEFYPVSAACVEGRNNCLQHSIKKWDGLTKDNLDKHRCSIRKAGGHLMIYDVYQLGDSMSMAFSCALCQEYLDRETQSDPHPCHKCPLYQFRNGVPCDDASENDIEGLSPFQHFFHFSNPQPMRDLLKAAAEFYKDIPE